MAILREQLPGTVRSSSWTHGLNGELCPEHRPERTPHSLFLRPLPSAPTRTLPSVPPPPRTPHLHPLEKKKVLKEIESNSKEWNLPWLVAILKVILILS